MRTSKTTILAAGTLFVLAFSLTAAAGDLPNTRHGDTNKVIQLDENQGPNGRTLPGRQGQLSAVQLDQIGRQKTAAPGGETRPLGRPGWTSESKEKGYVEKGPKPGPKKSNLMHGDATTPGPASGRLPAPRGGGDPRVQRGGGLVSDGLDEDELIAMPRGHTRQQDPDEEEPVQVRPNPLQNGGHR